MAKKKKFKFKRRNAAPAAAPSRPRAPRATRPGGDAGFGRLAYTAAGAGGTALVGALLARNGFHPKTAAATLAAVGAGLAWKGDSPNVRNIGSGVMSAGGAQLALLAIDSHTEKMDEQKAGDKKPDARKPSNAEALPPGMLESAFERAKSRLALVGGDA
jgi:hypothetical protein